MTSRELIMAKTAAAAMLYGQLRLVNSYTSEKACREEAINTVSRMFEEFSNATPR